MCYRKAGGIKFSTQAFMLCGLVGLTFPAMAEVSASYTGGAMRVGPAVATTCDETTTKGAIRFNDTADILEYCNGSNWSSVVTAGSASADPLPNAFSFTDVTGQPLNTLIYSNTLTISGFLGPVLAEVSGAGTPQISINSGPWVSAGNINPGDTIRVRQISSNVVTTARVAAVTIGTGTDNWSVTTTGGALRMFPTNGWYLPDVIASLANADAICATEAGALGYVGTWKAIMSDSTTDARDRLTLSYPIVRAASTTTVIEATNLWAASLEADVSTGYGSVSRIWSGTFSSGTKSSDTCTNWTSNSSGVNGRVGTLWSNATDAAWISSTNNACNTANRLLCIEQ